MSGPPAITESHTRFAVIDGYTLRNILKDIYDDIPAEVAMPPMIERLLEESDPPTWLFAKEF